MSLNANIFAPKCVGCHGPTNATGGIRLDTYANVFKRVNVGSPTSSKVYSITRSGEMPPRPAAMLSTAETNAILAWVQGGALNN